MVQHSVRWRIFCGISLAVLSCLALAPIALAQTTDEAGCGCHSLERETWEMSTHGQLTTDGAPIAACDTCHGVYTRGHPEADMIPLKSDSSTCIECHDALAHNWEQTVHAQAGVQCIGCHLVHSQDLRLNEQSLCESCHRETLQDPLHTAHWLGDVSCTNCHMADRIMAVGEQIATADPSLALLTAPRHDFVAVSGSNCIDCHAQQVKDGANGGSRTFPQRLAVIEAAAEAPILRAKVNEAELAARTASLFVPMGIGFGVSIGGILGIAFVLVIARWGRKGGL